MVPPSRSDDFDPPGRSPSTRIAGTVERVCVVGVRLSIPLLLLVVSSFAAYLVGGYVLTSLGVWSPGYTFLSLPEDVYFAWFSFISGGTICLGTGSLIGLAFLTEGEGQIHNEISILASFVGFGFGAGVMRITYATVLASLS
ncbi:hypothetical protein [Halomarina pelagica]|uniref:hypothetical protein n=1 Tax=Halomarina pelagica TaxID=2961599 RepID=UPI0020C4E55B|nr:hypothetical protein [Halomarina sp. BND7]